MRLSPPPFDEDADLSGLIGEMKSKVPPLALIGAGASVSSGYPSWDELLERLDERLRAPSSAGGKSPPKLLAVVRDLKDPAWQAEEYLNHLGTRRFQSLLRRMFADPVKVEEPHHTIARLGFRHYLTTNFDPCIERALGRAKRPHAVVHWSSPPEYQRFLRDLGNPDATPSVVYLHGRFDRPKEIVLTESAYSRVYLREDAKRRLTAVFMTQSVVFLGFSMNDPDLGQLLREVLATLGPGYRDARHYGVFGYRTTDERDLIRRRMHGKFGLRSIFYRVLSDANGRSDHSNLLVLLEHIGSKLSASRFPHVRGSHPPVARSKQKKLGPIEPLRDPLDPQKGRWGGSPEANGRRLKVRSIRVVEPKSSLGFEIVVEAMPDSRPLVGAVKFHLHDTFDTPDFVEDVHRGRATTRIRRAYGAFTIGVEADAGSTRLELDLAEIQKFPAWFRER